MFNSWLISDIEQAAERSNRVVISDPEQFLTFMVNELRDYAVITLNSAEEEMRARHLAQTGYADSKVVFLCFFPKREITQLIEFAGIGGYINFDNPDVYIRTKLYNEGLGNVTISESELRLAAKLSFGKDLRWWSGIVIETIEPLNIQEHLAELIQNPAQYQAYNDEDVYEVLRTKLFALMGKNPLPVDATVLMRELTVSMFTQLASGNVTPQMFKVYDWWSNNTQLLDALRMWLSEWNLAATVSPLTAHHDHPFAELNRKLLVEISNRLRANETMVDVAEAIKRRIKSRTASALKPAWLSDLLILIQYDSTDMYRFDTLSKLTKYYQTKFAPLDTAMRHLYSVWLGEQSLLRPLQELYEVHLKALLSSWFMVATSEYKPNQLNLVAQALGSGNKVAVMVCDGLRLEIAETIASRFNGSKDVTRDIRNAKLPSVTENGMSALFGIDEVVYSTAARFDQLRCEAANVEIINYQNLNDGITADKLVLMFGDIDQVGEHKGLNGLRDINEYESDIAEAVTRLLNAGYQDVYLTADHGFVITGILDEASKVPAPAGMDVKERFCLSDNLVFEQSLIRREDNFPGGQFQYYAKTDRPFRTRGAYGYSHGGFTPQECLIPFYKISSKHDATLLDVKIANKAELMGVTGQFFTVKLNGSTNSAGKRVKVSLHNDKTPITPSIALIQPEGTASVEFELTASSASVTVVDAETGQQLDAATVNKSITRDIDFF